MSIIHSVVIDELDRSRRMRQAYELELSVLPREAVVRKRIKGHEYYYWMSRKNGKVVNRYVSPQDNDIPQLLQQDLRRRHLVKLIAKLKKEQSEMERFLKVSTNG